MKQNATLDQAPRRQGRESELQGQIEKLFRRLRLAMVYGGNKQDEGAVIEVTTNPRSWKSYQRVAEDIAGAMRRLGCKDVELFADDMRLGERLRSHQSHLAWLNTGGVQGHCSVAHAAAMMEMFGIPYVGHDPMMAGILDNKHVFKRQLRATGIPTADFYVWQPGQGSFDPTEDIGFSVAFEVPSGPFIVKPVSGRASLNVIHVEEARDLADAVRRVYEATRNLVLIESYLPGREFCVAVMGPTLARAGSIRRQDRPVVFSYIERVLDADEPIFTSMDAKPINDDRARVLDPVRDRDICRKLADLAHRVYTELGVETLIRLDVRADQAGNLFVLEANPKPDLKMPEAGVSSLVCMGLPQLGMTYDDLIMSVFADRVDALLSERRGIADRLTRIL